MVRRFRTRASASSWPAEAPGTTAPAAMEARPTAGQAVLDDAHIGDIRGALGSIRADALTERPTWRRRLLTLAAILGPGVIVMVGDNDAGGVATYAQAGQDYGYSLLWVLLLLIPVLIVNQEMVVRLGAVTGVGHARLIVERFGRGWGWFSVGDLFVLNFLTLATEFIGIALAADYIGLSKYLVVPIAAVVLVLITASGSFQRWERSLFVFIAVSFLQIPMLLLAHPHWAAIGRHLVVPGVAGGVTSNAVLLIIAIVGTTVAPWQLFFQQSNIIDKRITPRFISYERADTVIGSIFVIIGAIAIMVTAAYGAAGTGGYGHFTDAAGVAHLLRQHSPVLGAIFAVVLLDASIIGAAAVTLSTSYAFGDVFGIRHSLHRSFRDAKEFYLSYIGLVAAAAAIVLIPGAPLGLITTSVQVLAGLLLPSASVFLLLLCNDRHVLGPWTNPRWLNVVTGVIIGVLLLLSATLIVTTLFPEVPIVPLLIGLSTGLVVLGASGWLVARVSQRGRPSGQAGPPVYGDKQTWRMPSLAVLPPVEWSTWTKISMVALRGYLILSAVLLVVKAIRLAH
jgi:NRAMP (natural resistance-associated macrophage protein)-like metal ion transporter